MSCCTSCSSAPTCHYHKKNIFNYRSLFLLYNSSTYEAADVKGDVDIPFELLIRLFIFIFLFFPWATHSSTQG